MAHLGLSEIRLHQGVAVKLRTNEFLQGYCRMDIIIFTLSLVAKLKSSE